MEKEKQKNNMDLYDKFRTVPSEALKYFDNGKFKGTDINPMWRIKILTTVFGPCGKGWYFGQPEFTTEVDGNVKTVHCTVAIYWKLEDGTWSAPVYGVGGNTIANVRRDGNVSVSDEAYKMAFTDACGIAAKQLGVAADVWFEKDVTKYTQYQQFQQVQQPQQTQQPVSNCQANAKQMLQQSTQQVQQQVQQQPVSALPMLTDDQKVAAVNRYLKYNIAGKNHFAEKNIGLVQAFDILVENKRLDAIGNILDERVLAIISNEHNTVVDATVLVMDEDSLLKLSNDSIMKKEVKAVCTFFNNPVNAKHIPFYEKMIGNKLSEAIPNQCHLLYGQLISNKLIS